MKRGLQMGDKFLGIGLTNAIILFILYMIFSVFVKVIFTKHEVEGVSEIVRMA